jgi:hypothetical protein
MVFAGALALVLLPASVVSAGASDASTFARLVAERYQVDARRVATTDIDRDGDLDVVVATDRGFLVWVNDGAGRFTSEAPVRRPMVNGHAPDDTWSDAESSHDETIPSSAGSTPMAFGSGVVPPPLSAVSRVSNFIASRAGRTRGGSIPRAPPLAA